MKNLKRFNQFLLENVYVGVYKGEEMVAALLFNKIDDIETDYIDNFHDNGYILKSITKSEYDNFNEGDELSMSDFNKGNYKYDR